MRETPPSSSGSSSRRLRREQRKRAAAAPFANNIDQPVAYSLLALLLIYTIATVLAYIKISAREDAFVATTAAAAEVTAAVQANDDDKTEKQHSDIQELQHMFPIHVGNDTVVIDHPGLALASDTSQVPNDLEKRMVVPQFFDESHAKYFAGSSSIRDYLGNHGQQLMTVEQATSIGSFDRNGRETIYCSVAAYRDFECRDTVEDLYARAKYPQRIRVAILDQRLLQEDTPCAQPEFDCNDKPEQALCQYRHLMDVYDMDARLAVGPVFARHLGHRHYRGEYYAMQVDSHVRFTQDWDDDIIGQWKSAKNEMAVLTTYLSDITNSIDPVTHANSHPDRPIMCQSDYEGAGDYKHLRHGQQPEGRPGIHGQPTLHPFWAAGFSFARGHFVIQVPYDEYLPMVFQGEEISIGLRAFTYGYDFYAPERSVCFHRYASRDSTNERKKVPLFWEQANTYRGVGMRAMRRLNHIIGMNRPEEKENEDWQRDEQDKYGLGQVRNVSQFFTTFGIHTEQQTVEGHLCRFVGKPMMKLFLPLLRHNRMGIDYDKLGSFHFVDPAPEENKKKKGGGMVMRRRRRKR